MRARSLSLVALLGVLCVVVHAKSVVSSGPRHLVNEAYTVDGAYSLSVAGEATMKPLDLDADALLTGVTCTYDTLMLTYASAAEALNAYRAFGEGVVVSGSRKWGCLHSGNLDDPQLAVILRRVLSTSSHGTQIQLQTEHVSYADVFPSLDLSLEVSAFPGSAIDNTVAPVANPTAAADETRPLQRLWGHETVLAAAGAPVKAVARADGETASTARLTLAVGTVRLGNQAVFVSARAAVAVNASVSMKIVDGKTTDVRVNVGSIATMQVQVELSPHDQFTRHATLATGSLGPLEFSAAGVHFALECGVRLQGGVDALTSAPASLFIERESTVEAQTSMSYTPVDGVSVVSTPAITASSDVAPLNRGAETQAVAYLMPIVHVRFDGVARAVTAAADVSEVATSFLARASCVATENAVFDDYTSSSSSTTGTGTTSTGTTTTASSGTSKTSTGDSTSTTTSSSKSGPTTSSKTKSGKSSSSSTSTTAGTTATTHYATGGTTNGTTGGNHTSTTTGNSTTGNSTSSGGTNPYTGHSGSHSSSPTVSYTSTGPSTTFSPTHDSGTKSSGAFSSSKTSGSTKEFSSFSSLTTGTATKANENAWEREPVVVQPVEKARSKALSVEINSALQVAVAADVLFATPGSSAPAAVVYADLSAAEHRCEDVTALKSDAQAFDRVTPGRVWKGAAAKQECSMQMTVQAITPVDERSFTFIIGASANDCETQAEYLGEWTQGGHLVMKPTGHALHSTCGGDAFPSMNGFLSADAGLTLETPCGTVAFM